MLTCVHQDIYQKVEDVLHALPTIKELRITGVGRPLITEAVGLVLLDLEHDTVASYKKQCPKLSSCILASTSPPYLHLHTRLISFSRRQPLALRREDDRPPRLRRQHQHALLARPCADRALDRPERRERAHLVRVHAAHDELPGRALERAHCGDGAECAEADTEAACSATAPCGDAYGHAGAGDDALGICASLGHDHITGSCSAGPATSTDTRASAGGGSGAEPIYLSTLRMSILALITYQNVHMNRRGGLL